MILQPFEGKNAKKFTFKNMKISELTEYSGISCFEVNFWHFLSSNGSKMISLHQIHMKRVSSISPDPKLSKKYKPYDHTTHRTEVPPLFARYHKYENK